MAKISNQKKFSYALVVGFVGLLAIILVVNSAQNNIDEGNFDYVESDSVNNESSVGMKSITDDQKENSNYEDGIYTTEVSYGIEGVQDLVEVSFELQGGQIVDYQMKHISGKKKSKLYVDDFYNYSVDKVTDKSLDDDFSDLFLSGATNTSKSFQDAIEQIKKQADS
jgi:uncharacterized protein with FMN-binding domain